MGRESKQYALLYSLSPIQLSKLNENKKDKQVSNILHIDFTTEKFANLLNLFCLQFNEMPNKMIFIYGTGNRKQSYRLKYSSLLYCLFAITLNRVYLLLFRPCLNTYQIRND